MRILAQSLLFILNKWDTSLTEFKPIGKILFFIPMMLNNILVQIWYFLLFPIVCLYFYLKEKWEPYILIYRIFIFNNIKNINL
jgi:hypothetical protein